MPLSYMLIPNWKSAILLCARRWMKLIRVRGRFRFGRALSQLLKVRGRVLLQHVNMGRMVFDFDNPHEISMFFDLFAEDLSELIRCHLNRGGIFIDCGANTGYFTFLAASLIESEGTVISIEPNPYCADRIAESCELGGYKNVQLHRGAIAAKPGMIDFNIADDPMYSSIADLEGLHFARRLETIRVHVDGMDNILDQYLRDQLAPISLIKLDVEGAEVDVLRGLDGSLKSKRIDCLYVEIHPQQLAAKGQSPEDFHRIISSYGYKIAKQTGAYRYLYQR